MTAAVVPARAIGVPARLAQLAAVAAAAIGIAMLAPRAGSLGLPFWGAVVLVWALAWLLNRRLAGMTLAKGSASWLRDIAVPTVFGLTLLWLWEVICVGAKVPSALMPAPSAIAARIADSAPLLWVDFVQTVVRAVIPGWIMGSAAGFVVAVLCDRYESLRRGLLPVGNFISALPLIGIAPIMVMWFGFDWQSKAAVVVLMTFFPMLVNAIAGLAAAGRLERDLMRSYGASWWQTLVSLRIPAAMPFIFNALKINATLAMIGAIVAEFFGTPIVGMGFRISTGVGRLALDTVWATITIAAIVGSSFYGALVLVERAVTFWHPSVRSR
jgi:NitT/TauT family transport system permease protein